MNQDNEQGTDGVYLPDGEPYPTPTLSAQDALELEEATAQQVATVRDERSLVIANLGNDNVPHFLTTVDGAEQCGGCTQAWPCPAWVQEINPQAVEASSDRANPELVYTAEEIAAADLLGVTAAEVRELVKRR
jgi:hypothetical protein